MIWIGAIIVILTFVAIIKKVETRLVLFLSGVLMAAIAGGGNPWVAIAGFEGAMISKGLVPIITSVMGFAFVLKFTQCDQHLVHSLTKPLSVMRPILVPGAVLVTFLINIALTSAAGCAAAVGAILIPTLIRSGVHPATAAAAVFAGTWGSALNPGNPQVATISKVSGIEPIVVIAGHTSAVLIALVVVIVAVTIQAYLRKEVSGYVYTEDGEVGNRKFSVNFLKALVPVVPLLLILITDPKMQGAIASLFGAKTLGLPVIQILHAMLIGCGLAFLASLTTSMKTNMEQLENISKNFFTGLGEAYGSIIGIIIAAATFTAGMKAIGLTDALITLMKNSVSIAKFAATFGPMVIAVLSGSGDAATQAFNLSITPQAQSFGMSITDMGSQAFLTGSWGRTFSPVAGAAIVLATLAKVDPIELAKRNAIPMIAACITSMIVLLG